MARTIKEIQEAINADMVAAFPKLSSSAVAEWRLLTHVVAVAIHLFEVILDQFKQEIDHRISQITPGTRRWYVEMCYRYQNGHELKFDPSSAMYYYEKDDPAARIAKVVAVSDGNNHLAIKVATVDNASKVIPFSPVELGNFKNYISAIHFLGRSHTITSATADLIRYNVEVYYDKLHPEETVKQSVIEALESFKNSYQFNGIFYNQQMVDHILHCDGVVTVNLIKTERKGATEPEFTAIAAYEELHAGYFEWDEESVLIFKNIEE